MKRFLFAVVFVVMGFMSSVAIAQVAGYENGFYIRNEEKTFKLTLSGRLQTQFYYQYAKGQPKQLTFNIRRAQLNVGANFHNKVQMGFTLKHAMAGEENKTFETVQVDGATVAVKIIPEFIVEVGMVGLPLDMIGAAGSSWLLLFEPPVTNTEDDSGYKVTVNRPSFGAPSGLGINFSGDYWKWFYSLSVINGAESNYDINTNMRMSVGVRTGFNILDPVPNSQTDFENSATPKLTVSAGSNYENQQTDKSGSIVKYRWTSTLGVGFRWKGLALTTEGYYRKTRVSSVAASDVVWSRPHLTDIGYYAAAGYYVIPKKLEIAAQAGQIIRQGPANDAWQVGGGINYYVFDNNLKLQLMYSIQRDYNDGSGGTLAGSQGRKTHVVGLMLTSSF